MDKRAFTWIYAPVLLLILLQPSTPVWRSSYVPTKSAPEYPAANTATDARPAIAGARPPNDTDSHYTKECTRSAQPLYSQQALERYTPLMGYKSLSRKSWFDTFGLTDAAEQPFQGAGSRRDVMGSDHKYFFAINLYNSFDVIPDLFAALFRVSAILGYHNVFVSIYENGSTDQTKALLRIFDALTRSVGMRITIRTSMRTRGAFNHRIEYLAEVRNAAFVPLHELRDAENEYFDTIIFMNDILPCVDDLLELIWQSRNNNAGITCAATTCTTRILGPLFSTTIGSPEISTVPLWRTRRSSRYSTTPFVTALPETFAGPGAVMLEWHRRAGSRTVLLPSPRQVQDGQDHGR